MPAFLVIFLFVHLTGDVIMIGDNMPTSHYYGTVCDLDATKTLSSGNNVHRLMDSHEPCWVQFQ